jgi:hypothetical protein
LPMFAMVFKCFFASVSEACFKCFIYLLLYVVSVASGCFKSRWASATDLHLVGVDLISGGVSCLHGGWWWRADHARAAVVNGGLRPLSDVCLRAAQAPTWVHEIAQKAESRRGHPGAPSVRTSGH